MGKTIYKMFLEVFGDFINENGFRKIVMNTFPNDRNNKYYYRYDEKLKLQRVFGYTISRGTETGWKTFDLMFGVNPLIKDYGPHLFSLFGGYSLAMYCRITLKREKKIPKSFTADLYMPWQFKENNEEETLEQLLDAKEAFNKYGKDFLFSDNFDDIYKGYRRLTPSYNINYGSIEYAVFANDKTEALRISDNIIHSIESDIENSRVMSEKMAQLPNFEKKNSKESLNYKFYNNMIELAERRLQEATKMKQRIETEFDIMKEELCHNREKNIDIIMNVENY